MSLKLLGRRTDRARTVHWLRSKVLTLRSFHLRTLIIALSLACDVVVSKYMKRGYPGISCRSLAIPYLLQKHQPPQGRPRPRILPQKPLLIQPAITDIEKMDPRNMTTENLAGATTDERRIPQLSQDTSRLIEHNVPPNLGIPGWERCLVPIGSLTYPYFTPLPEFCLYNDKEVRKHRKLIIEAAAVQVHEAWMSLYGCVMLDVDFENSSIPRTRLLRMCCESLKNQGWAVSFMRANDTSDRTVQDINRFFDRVENFASLYEAAIFLCSGVLMYHYRGQNNNEESVNLQWSCYLEAHVWLTRLIDEWKAQAVSQLLH